VARRSNYIPRVLGRDRSPFPSSLPPSLAEGHFSPRPRSIPFSFFLFRCGRMQTRSGAAPLRLFPPIHSEAFSSGDSLSPPLLRDPTSVRDMVCLALFFLSPVLVIRNRSSFYLSDAVRHRCAVPRRPSCLSSKQLFATVCETALLLENEGDVPVSRAPGRARNPWPFPFRYLTVLLRFTRLLLPFFASVTWKVTPFCSVLAALRRVHLDSPTLPHIDLPVLFWFLLSVHAS